ncbi:MAG: McrB family protein [Chryseobacterium jejuense]|uniref:McrB family protein n=1 Tax=Chryseobacterium jejuense TaxID=445960 RepID=UPI003D13EE37
MSNRLKNIYTYLVQNRKHQLQGWHDEYETLVSDIKIINENLSNGKALKDEETYQKTSFKDYDNFINVLIYDTANGISSRGRSVLSWENLNKFKNDKDFDEVISNIIKKPSLETYQKLQEFWLGQKVGFNPVLINRALAAASIELTSTVDEGKFNEVFYWLQSKELISKYTAPGQDWYSKNIFVMSELKKGLRDVADIDDFWISLFYWEMYLNLSNPFTLKKQIIKYGAPGTGKTYKAKELSKLQFEIWKSEFAENEEYTFEKLIETIQFHPSYTYEDFMEGLRPMLDDNKQAQLNLQNGIFKSFCIHAGKWECDVMRLNLKKDWNTITIEELIQYRDNLQGDHWDYIFKISDQSKKISDAVPPHFMIIDEINRAELSRVFGELMLCLEYRGRDGMVKTQYSQLNNEKTGMIKQGGDYKFFIPHNVYILGTMNTIDRSVESFDFALRRRFKWEEVDPDISLLKYHLKEHHENWLPLADNLSSLNGEIEIQPLLGKDYRIGHAYLWKLRYSKNQEVREVRKMIWKDSISPLLEEYLRGTGREDLMDVFAKKFGL